MKQQYISASKKALNKKNREGIKIKDLIVHPYLFHIRHPEKIKMINTIEWEVKEDKYGNVILTKNGTSINLLSLFTTKRAAFKDIVHKRLYLIKHKMKILNKEINSLNAKLMRNL